MLCGWDYADVFVRSRQVDGFDASEMMLEQIGMCWLSDMHKRKKGWNCTVAREYR